MKPEAKHGLFSSTPNLDFETFHVLDSQVCLLRDMNINSKNIPKASKIDPTVKDYIYKKDRQRKII